LRRGTIGRSDRATGRAKRTRCPRVARIGEVVFSACPVEFAFAVEARAECDRLALSVEFITLVNVSAQLVEPAIGESYADHTAI